MMFVWLYWNGGAQSDELRWSIRSVLQNYRDGQTPQIMLIGDPPRWYSGPLIHVPRVRKQYRHAFRDVLNKLHTACTSPLVDDQFVWMMDDVYFLRPLRFRDLRKHYYGGRVPARVKAKGGWPALKRDTFRVIQEAGKVPIDYCTHLPHIVDKWRFLHVWTKYGLAHRVLQWELLYGAEFFVRRRRVNGRVRGRVRKHGRIFSNQLFGNNTVGGWSGALHAELHRRFPQPSPFEAGAMVYLKQTLPAAVRSAIGCPDESPIDVDAAIADPVGTLDRLLATHQLSVTSEQYQQAFKAIKQVA